MDWDTINTNKIIRYHEYISRGFQKLDLDLRKWEEYKKNLKIFQIKLMSKCI